MPLLQTTGNSTIDAYGGGAAAVPNYIEDVFSTYLYTGTGAAQTITTNIDVSTKGGIVWTKPRVANPASSDHVIHQTNGNSLVINSLGAEYADGDFGSITSTGFTLPAYDAYNASGITFASWTFREQPKFFDIVTYTGNGTSSRNIAHNLGSTPGCIIVKRTDSTSDWFVSHVGYNSGLAYTGVLNSAAAFALGTQASVFYSTSTTFRVGTGANQSGSTYVAYLFAHDAGGFGLTGTDNVISCGSFTTDGSGNATVSLGYEPQYIMVKRTDSAGDWLMLDVMRGWSQTKDAFLYANYSDAEAEVSGNYVYPTSTGFVSANGGFSSSATFIYIAIRRGPMKVPTDGTKVFTPVAYTGTNVDNRLVNTGIVTDMTMARIRTATSTGGFYTADRLRSDYFLGTAVATAEAVDADSFMTPTLGVGNSFSAMNGFGVGNDATRQLNQSSTNQLAYAFKRAPSFFDEVCYTGIGSNTTQTHNLGAIPELIIVKGRSGATAWQVYSSALANTEYVVLNTTAAKATDATRWNSTTPTSTVFSIGTASEVNTSGVTYAAYLFATCAGVSKVGSYTGNGTTQSIACGFTGGARFVMIKRTDATGNWGVLDTARGMVSGTDPYLNLNTTAAEVNANNVYTTTGGFQLVSSDANFNASGGSYIFLAVA